MPSTASSRESTIPPEPSLAANGATSVLVVEDDDDIREILTELLDGAGLRTIGVAHGRAALDWIAHSPARPAVILLDLGMPVMDGHEFLAVRATDPSLAEIPVIVMSGARDGHPDEATDVLAKPVRLDALLATIARHAAP